MSVLDPAPPRADSRALLLPELVAATLATAVVVLFGAPAGLLWSRVAPDVLVVPQGGDAYSYVDPETRSFLGGDVAFGLVGLGLGLLCGAGAHLLVRRSGPGAAVGLLAGGLCAAWVARHVGEQAGLEAFRRALHAGPVGGTVAESVKLRAGGLMVAWPVGALATFALLGWLRPAGRWGVSSG